MSILKRFLLMDMLFEGGRMFVGGVSAAYLISKGISISDIAIIKAWQALMLFIAEIPTGLFADKFSRKLGTSISVLCAIIGLLFYISSQQLFFFIAGETFMALSLCFWSGAYEAWVSTETSIESSPEEIQHFFHNNFSLNQTAVVICGFLGGYFAGEKNYINAYYAAVVVMVGLFFYMQFIGETKFKIIKHETNQVNQSILKQSIIEIFKNEKLIKIVSISVLLQFLVQPLLHYWQPWMQVLNPQLNASGLGYVFALYSGATAFFGFYFKKIKKLPIGMILVSWLVLYFILGFNQIFYQVLIIFITQQVFYSIVKTRYIAQLVIEAPSKLKASIMSINSFISRLGMFMSLGVLHYHFQSARTVTLTQYQSVFLVLGVVGFVSLIIVSVFRLQNLQMCKLSSLSTKVQE